MPHAASAAAEVIAKYPISAVISTSPPLVCHLTAAWLKLRYRIPWVADFRDPLSDNPFRSRTWARPYDRILERWMFASADAIIGVTDSVAATWRKRYPRWARKFHVVWNGYDPEEQIPFAAAQARHCRRLAHIGNLYGARRPAAVFSSLSRLLHSGILAADALKIQLVGEVQESALPSGDEAVRKLRECGILEELGVVSRQDALRMTAEADYLLLVDTNARDLGYTVPAKLFEYIRAGRPILAITAQGSPVEQILEKAGIPNLVIHPQDNHQLVDVRLAEFLSQPSRAHTPNAWFLERFDGKRQAGQIAAICGQVTAG
jgi:glycosyltransferase involved in cell wall biosynthesis